MRLCHSGTGNLHPPHTADPHAALGPRGTRTSALHTSLTLSLQAVHDAANHQQQLRIPSVRAFGAVSLLPPLTQHAAAAGEAVSRVLRDVTRCVAR